MKNRKHAPGAPLIIGWRETIGLSDLGITKLEAKIDTGARSTALHAGGVATFEQDGRQWVRFDVVHRDKRLAEGCSAPLVDRRMIKNTSGIPEPRLVIETMLVLGHRRWHIEITLADRANMAFPLILGRTAIRRHKVLVDPGRSHLLQRQAPSHSRRKART